MPETHPAPFPPIERQARDRSDDDVTVSPRYLAGSSWTGDDALVPLTYHYWHDMHDEMGNYYITTCDSRLRIAYVPEISELLPDATALWQIRARTDIDQPPRWTAAFTDDTPPEIIAGIAAALDADVRASSAETCSYLKRDDHPDAVWDVLRAARWTVTADGFGVEAVSPDALASLAYRPPGPDIPRAEAWRATIRADAEARWPLWEADFHSATPAHLVAAFATALTDPAPLTRERQAVPAQCLSYIRPIQPAASNASAPTVTPPTITPLDVRRAQAARASSPSPASTLRWSTRSPHRAAPPAAASHPPPPLRGRR